MSIPRRLGRLARGIALSAQEEDRQKIEEVLRSGRERTENLRNALRTGYDTWKTAEEERKQREEEQERRERRQTRQEGNGRPYFRPRRYPPEVARAYQRLGLDLGSPLTDVRARRRELIKRHHPDRFSEPDRRLRAERLAAEINASHDVIARHLGA